MRTSRKVLVALGAAVVAPSAAAYRFAIEYRRRAGLPARRPPLETPEAYDLPFEIVAVQSDTGSLPGWFVPGPGGRPAPAVVLVHGWESNRARMLPNARFLRAAGFASLLFDVRGHGDNPPETLPISAAEFGADARAAVELAAARPDVTAVAVLGHSMGAIGAAIAAADDPRIAALVLTAAPADPRRLTRRTFQLAGLTMPGLIAQPLAALTTRVYLRPRGLAPSAVSATAAVRRYLGPVLIVHGEQDEVVGADNAVRLDRAARGVAGREVELLILPEGRHRWLYEDPAYRGGIAAFLARNLAGAAEPDRAAARAVAARVRRPPDTDGPLSALERPAAPAPAPLGRNGGLSGGTLFDAALPDAALDDPAGTHIDPDPIRSDGPTRTGAPGGTRMEPALGTWEAIDSLRVVRTFADRPLDPAAVERILNAGRRAGSSKNLQRWAFVVCRDREHLRELSTVGPFAAHLAGAAVAIALVTPNPHADGAPLSIEFDIGRAAQNMVLAAWELGIGSVPATVYEQARAAALLGLPEGMHCEYVLSFGYPADESVLAAPKRAGGRRPLSELVHEERW